MSTIAGIQTFSYGQAACLLADGRLKAFIEEEKLSRHKGESGNFPKHSLDFCLAEAGLTLSEVDEVAVPWEPRVLFLTALTYGIKDLLKRVFGGRPSPKAGAQPVDLFYDRFLFMVKHSPGFMKNLIKHHLRFSHRGLSLPAISFVAHHQAHAASAYYLSGFDKATVVIMDGLGDSESASIWKAEGARLDRLETVYFPNSLGEFYAAFTQFLSFKPYEEEGKLMGLAAYGRRDAGLFKKMENVIRIQTGGYRVNTEYTVAGAHSHGTYFSDKLVELFGSPHDPKLDFTEPDYHLAYAVQYHLEQAALALVRKAIGLTGYRNLCLAGGVAMNCKMNGVIQECEEVLSLFVMPAAGDAGAGLGAALVRSAAHGNDPRFELTHAYYGPGFSQAQIQKSLDRAGIEGRPIGPDGANLIANEIAEGKVIGLFQGRMEFGARALGARSILANPLLPGMKDKVNEKIKFREPWRPFAPAVLEGTEKDYFESGRKSRFMMKAFRAKEQTLRLTPEIVHVDGTCRPQTVSPEANPVYHAILKAFYEKTGVPILLNTSFNVRGEPMVSSPEDALRTFFSSRMDALLIGNYWLAKPLYPRYNSPACPSFALIP